MSTRAAKSASPFSGPVIGFLVAVGLASFIGVFALLGWSPDLADKNRAGPHPYSESALGYAGLIKLLEADGRPVSVSRLASTLDYADGLLILTIPEYGYRRSSQFNQATVSQPALFVLPKWSGYPDRARPSWQEDTYLIGRDRVQGLIRNFDTDATVWHLRNPARFETPFGTVKPGFEHKMQVIESDSLEPIISVPGGALLSKVPGSDVFILSDPDVFNTFGLVRRENARFALGLIDWLSQYSGDEVIFDATLHGFERSENLMRAIFDVPFLGATLLAFVTACLIGWAAFVRLSPQEREGRVLAFGKKALADNSAGLIAMARREGPMAPGYLQLSRRALIRRLGLPRTVSDEELARTLRAISKQREIGGDWSERASGLQTAALSREDLRDKARALWRWRKEMTHGD